MAVNAQSLLDSILGVGAGAKSPEPASTSPAPASTGLSQLDLLFKSAAQPTPAPAQQPSAPSSSSVASPPPNAPASLLALFANAGGSSTPLQSPPPPPVASPPASTNGDRSSANLLAMLFSPQATPAPPPAPEPSAPEASDPAAVEASEQEVSVPAKDSEALTEPDPTPIETAGEPVAAVVEEKEPPSVKVEEPVAPPAAAPSAPPPPPPTSSSPFTFVSPFDVLTGKNRKASSVQPKVEPAAPSAPSSVNGGDASAVGTAEAPARANGTDSSSAPAPADLPAPTRAPVSRVASSSAAARKIPGHLGSPPRSSLTKPAQLAADVYRQSQRNRNGKQPAGPRKLDSEERRHLVFDVTGGNETSLLKELPKMTQLTSLVVAAKYERGRKLVFTGDVLSYGNRHGRLRVLDRESAASVVLKAHTEPVIELDVDVAATEGSSARIVSCARDGRLVIWRIPTKIGIDAPAPFSIEANIVSSSPSRFVAVRCHPTRPGTIFVATSDKRIRVLDLAQLGYTLKAAKGEDVSEELAFHDADELSLTSDCIDMAMLSDGKSFAFLTANGAIDLHSTDRVAHFIRQLRPPVDAPTASPCQLVAIGDSVLAAASASGTVVDFISVADGSTVAKLELTGSADTFGHLAWSAELETLFLSVSSRSSVLAIKVDAQTGLKSILEIATSDPVLSLDPHFDAHANEAQLFMHATKGVSSVAIDARALGSVVAKPAPKAKPTPAAPKSTPAAKAPAKAEPDVEAKPTPVELSKAVEAPVAPTAPVVTEKAAPATAPAPSASAPAVSSDSLIEVVRERLSAFELRLDEDRSTQRAADTAKQAELIHRSSSVLAGALIGQLSPTVRTEVEAVIPRLSAAINEALKSMVEAETARGVREAVQQSVPEAIDRLLNRPMISRQIVSALVSAASPVIDQALSAAIADTLVPSMKAATETVLSSVASQLRSEMLEIRKEIVAEQSSVMSQLSTEIGSLRSLVGSLQAQIRDMSGNAARSTSSYNAAPGSSRPQTATNFATHSRVASGNQSFAAQPLQAQPILAPPPPPPPAAGNVSQQFEDFLLNALVGPTNGQLDSFISEDSVNRIQTVFPATGRRHLSQPVTIALCRRLAVDAAANTTQPNGPLNQARLNWLNAAFLAVDPTDPSIQEHMNRVFVEVLRELTILSSHLQAINDAQTGGNIHRLYQGIRAKFNL